MDQRHVLFVAQIAEAAIDGDRSRVEAYLKQFAEHLSADGDTMAADRLNKVIGRKTARRASLTQRSGDAPRLPVDSETAFGIADREEIPQGSVDVVFNNEHNQTILRFIQYVNESERLKSAGVSASPTLLMYGLPGTGKTQAARYIASELQLPLVTARTDSLISSYLGSTSKNVRRLFEYARSEPCVLFLDEFDAIAKMRDDSRELGELKRVVISLLQNIDSLEGEHVLIAATNHEHLLDRAIWRRFAYKLKLDLPNAEMRRIMLKCFFGKFLATDAIDDLVPLSDQLSGAQLKLAVEDCIRASVLKGDRQVVPVDAVAALLKEHGFHFADKSEMIRFLRKRDKKVFTQPALARLFDVSQPYISKVLKKETSRG